MDFAAMGIVAQGLGSRCAELQSLRCRSGQARCSFRSDVAGRSFSLSPWACCSAGFGGLAALTGPAPPDGGAECDGWIMRHPPMAVRGILESGRG